MTDMPTYSRAEVVRDMLTGMDLAEAKRLVIREESIRRTMAETGEGREVVVEAVDALESMEREAVTDLMDGEPTTLRAALLAYVAELEKRDPDGDELIPAARVVDELGTLLGYPWSGEEEILASHTGRSVPTLHIEEGDNRDLEIRIGSNRWLVATVNWEDAGSGGQLAAQRVAEAVHRAVLARIIGDRDHHVRLSRADADRLASWLKVRHLGGGSWTSLDGEARRVSVDTVADGGVLVRTRPYAWHAGDGAVNEARRLQEGR